MKMRNTQRVLTLAIMAALLSGGTVWAADISTTDTVKWDNNMSSETDKYSSITVENDSGNAFAIRQVGGNPVYVTDGAIISATATTTGNDARAYGLYAYNENDNTINGNATISATATATTTGDDAYAHGLCALTYGSNTINGNATISATATTTGNAAYASGLYANHNSNNTVNGDAIIAAKATATQAGKEFKAYSLLASGGGAVNDLTNRAGKLTQLQGDVYAFLATNKIMLDGAASYLQGNLLNGEGTNNLTIANGATWKPVYDNRYGSYFDAGNADTFVKTYSVKDIATTVNDNIALRDGGIIDLTWDGWENGTYTPMSGRSSNGYRTLTIDSLSGNGGIFRIDTDLANGNADKITLNSATSGSNMQIQVNYDPYFVTNPATGDTLAAKDGGVGVLNGTAANTITVIGAASEYNAYKFTPTVVWNETKSQWEITSLTTTDVPPEPPTPTPEPTPEPTPTPTVTTNVMTAADSRMVVNEMWLGDTNSLNKRLGELRSTKPEGGIWARYGHGKLKNGEDRRAELKYNLFQVGYDKSSPTDSGSTVYRGLALTHTKGDSSYETGSGEAKYTNFALYQTWLGKGHDYYDIILKYGRLSNDYKMVDISGNYSTADYAAPAWTLSGEYGKRFALGGGYIEPNAELILGHIGSADYTTSKGMKVNVDASKHAITRLGFNLGKEFTNANAYFKANYYHDFAGNGGIVADTVSYSREGFKNWYEIGLGGAAKLGKNTSAYAEVNKYFGDMKSDVTFNVGLRYSF